MVTQTTTCQFALKVVPAALATALPECWYPSLCESVMWSALLFFFCKRNIRLQPMEGLFDIAAQELNGWLNLF